VRAATGLPITATEMWTRVIWRWSKIHRLPQIGSRNIQNFALLKEVGRSRLPVASTGRSGDLLMSAEYILSETPTFSSASAASHL